MHTKIIFKKLSRIRKHMNQENIECMTKKTYFNKL